MAKQYSFIARFFLFFLALLLCTNSFAQNVTADSIRRELAALDRNSPKYLDEKIGALGTLYLTILHTDPEEAIKVADQLAACNKEKGDSLNYYQTLYRYKANAYEHMGDHASNILYLEAYAQALNRLDKNDGYVYIDIGNAYFASNLNGLAKGCYRQAEEIFAKANNIEGQCVVRNNYAQIYMQYNQYDSALYQLRLVHDLRVKKLNDPVLAGDSKFLIAICFNYLNQTDSAKYYFHRVVDLIGTPALQAHTDHVALQEEYTGAYNRLAMIYVGEKNWDSAAYYLRTGYAFCEKAGYTNRVTNFYSTWASFYLGKEMYDSAFVNIQRFDKRIAARPTPEFKLRLYKLYADYYDRTKDKEGYYKYMMMYYMLNDSLKGESIDEGSLLASGTMMQLKNKSRIEEQNVTLAQQEKEKLRLYIISGLLLFIISAGFIFFFQIRKKNKLIQRYNLDLEEANATKEKFLSVISHDLRSPFNTLIGMSNILVNNVKENKLDKISANAEAINESSRKAYVLLDNLMQWVSLQKEKISIKKESLQANEVVEEVLLLFRNQALAQSITIRKDIRVSGIFTDKNLLQVVLRNLLSNAIRHIPVGGTVKICIEASGKDVHLTVQDNGHGIDEETLKTLFTKKDHAGIARKGGGLGLLLVSEFVEQLDGTIKAENMKEGGAKFTIVLHGAALESSVSAGEELEQLEELKFTEKEKQRMRVLVQDISKYEIFDTTELRKCFDEFDVTGSPAMRAWIKNLSQAVYHANNEQFKKLTDLANS